MQISAYLLTKFISRLLSQFSSSTVPTLFTTISSLPNSCCVDLKTAIKSETNAVYNEWQLDNDFNKESQVHQPLKGGTIVPNKC